MTSGRIGVFAAYVSAKGHTFVDRALYLPRNWTTDTLRLAATHVSEGTAFATKPALAVEMIGRVLTTDMPFAWVAADAVYGVGDIEQALRRAGKGYMPGVKGDHRFGSWGGKPVVAVGRKTYRTHNHAKVDVFDYIERFYNPTRRHPTLDYLSLMDFERQAQLA